MGDQDANVDVTEADRAAARVQVAASTRWVIPMSVFMLASVMATAALALELLAPNLGESARSSGSV
jgi:hypothetical protein